MKYKNFLLRAVNLLLILGILWQYQQVALVRAAAVSQRKQEMQHRAGSRGQDAQRAQKDERGVEAEDKAVIAAHPLLQGVGNGF